MPGLGLTAAAGPGHHRPLAGGVLLLAVFETFVAPMLRVLALVLFPGLECCWVRTGRAASTSMTRSWRRPSAPSDPWRPTSRVDLTAGWHDIRAIAVSAFLLGTVGVLVAAPSVGADDAIVPGAGARTQPEPRVCRARV